MHFNYKIAHTQIYWKRDKNYCKYLPAVPSEAVDCAPFILLSLFDFCGVTRFDGFTSISSQSLQSSSVLISSFLTKKR